MTPYVHIPLLHRYPTNETPPQFTHYTFHDRQNGKTGLDYANDDNNMKYPLNWASMSGEDFTSIVAMEETLARTYYSDLSKIGSARHSYCCAHCDERVGIGSDRRVSFKTIIWHLNYAYVYHSHYS